MSTDEEDDENKPSKELLDALDRYAERRRRVLAALRAKPSTKVEVKIARTVEDLPNGTKRSILTCLGGRYRLWPDFLTPSRWRWSLRDWPDDDQGTHNYGAGTLHECVQACVDHFVFHNPGKQIPVE
jgi:hypothetical protein